MRVNMDSSIVSDPRFKLMARRLGINWREALGACYLVWLVCYERRTGCLSAEEIDIASETDQFSAAMINVGLAHEDGAMVVIHGVSDRIAFLVRQHQLASNGGRAASRSKKKPVPNSADGNEIQEDQPEPSKRSRSRSGSKRPARSGTARTASSGNAHSANSGSAHPATSEPECSATGSREAIATSARVAYSPALDLALAPAQALAPSQDQQPGEKDIAATPLVGGDPGVVLTKPRARDAHWDALVEVTGSDSSIRSVASQIGKVRKSLLEASPPYTPDEILALPDIAARQLPWTAGRVLTLGEIEKNIGLVRSQAKTVPRRPPPGRDLRQNIIDSGNEFLRMTGGAS